jgi:hypothetical protein
VVSSRTEAVYALARAGIGIGDLEAGVAAAARG